MEPITVARKPLVGTVAENVLTHGTGAINVDGCRVSTCDQLGGGRLTGATRVGEGWDRPWMNDPERREADAMEMAGKVAKAEAFGRWPANLIHDGSDEVTGLLGDAARFFYCPKASKADRDEGCEGMEERDAAGYDPRPSGDFAERMNRQRPDVVRRNHHPTVKPTDLMRYLCRLVTPPGGIVLDPFTGSGSTGKAAVLEGFEFIGIEREAEYVALARARIAPKIDRQRTLFS
jgi:site-specific DNA-methyltransferase (adenine-specific)